MSEFHYVPEATPIRIVCTNGVIPASEKRVSYSDLVISKKGKKVFKITDGIAPRARD